MLLSGRTLAERRARSTKDRETRKKKRKGGGQVKITSVRTPSHVCFAKREHGPPANSEKALISSRAEEPWEKNKASRTEEHSSSKYAWEAKPQRVIYFALRAKEERERG